MDLHENELCMSDENSGLVTMTMVSAVVAMALIMMATVLAFHNGGTIL